MMKKTTDYSGKSGLYCCVTPVKGFGQLRKILSDRLEEENIDCEPFEEMHCTIMYSRDDAPHSIRVIQLLDAPPFSYKAWTDKLDYWDGHDGKGYLVLRLTSHDLAVRHEQYKDLGCTHSFPNYEAHITIASDIKKPDCFAELNRMLKNNKFEITFNGEHVEDIKGD